MNKPENEKLPLLFVILCVLVIAFCLHAVGSFATWVTCEQLYPGQPIQFCYRGVLGL